MTTTYTITACEAISYKCINDSTAGCKAKACTDYTKTDGLSGG